MKAIKNGKRVKIRIASFFLAITATLCVWGIMQTIKVNNYAKEITIAHQRTIASLSSYINSLETDLRKLQYANTSPMTSGISLSLCKASAGAKNCLSELSSGEAPLNNINKFLTQASDYATTISKKAAAGEEITAEERETITELYRYASELSEQISYMEQMMFSQELTFEESAEKSGLMENTENLQISYQDSISDAEKSFSDYPTLIYDGPFSDNISVKESVLLKNQDEISQSEAKKLAAKYSGIKENLLNNAEDENSTIASYVFYHENTTVAITKKGGFLHYLLTDKYAGQEKINENEAVQIALKYLEEAGFKNMKDSYYYDSDGICTVNFAYTQDDAICYADLIKVSVSLDKGEITAVDCTGYLINHTQRQMPKETINAAKAGSSIASSLTIKQTRKAFIPMQYSSEVFTYEFLCTDNSGNDVLIYINAENGEEADIKLLLYSDGGTLTR